MEQNLEKCMAEIIAEAGVIGCLMSDSQGLCLGVQGKASNESSGIITAIASQVAQLESGAKPPVILFENENRQCLIQQNGNVTCAIYKKLPAT